MPDRRRRGSLHRSLDVPEHVPTRLQNRRSLRRQSRRRVLVPVPRITRGKLRRPLRRPRRRRAQIAARRLPRRNDRGPLGGPAAGSVDRALRTSAVGRGNRPLRCSRRRWVEVSAHPLAAWSIRQATGLSGSPPGSPRRTLGPPRALRTGAGVLGSLRGPSSRRWAGPSVCEEGLPAAGQESQAAEEGLPGAGGGPRVPGRGRGGAGPEPRTAGERPRRARPGLRRPCRELGGDCWTHGGDVRRRTRSILVSSRLAAEPVPESGRWTPLPPEVALGRGGSTLPRWVGPRGGGGPLPCCLALGCDRGTMVR